jgi:4-diphosphocytidyl-2-C-methyl-D-erythritol kinase
MSSGASGAPGAPISSCVVDAPAKINLFLAVGPRRADGYHELSTVMQTVDLSDTLRLARADAPAVTFVRGRLRGPEGHAFPGDLPEAPDLVARALDLYASEMRRPLVLSAEVTKQIPIAAGLAGGSADAAAALLGADAIAGLETPRGQLEALGRRLGADVAFCLRGGTAYARGRGDQLSPLVCRHRVWWVLGISDFRLSTEDVYRRFDELAAGAPPTPSPPGGAGDARSEALEQAESGLLRPAKLIDGLTSGYPKVVGAALRNDLERAAFDLIPKLGGLKHAMRAHGALGAVLSGSGPTIAGICRDEAHAEEVAARAAPTFDRVEVVASTLAGATVVG